MLGTCGDLTYLQRGEWVKRGACIDPLAGSWEGKNKDALLLPIGPVNRRHVDCLNFERDYNYFLNRISQFTGRDVHSTATFEKFSRPLKIGSRLKIGQGGKSLLLTLRGKTREYFTFGMSHNPVYLQSNHRFREYEGEWESAETYFSQIEKYSRKRQRSKV